MEFDPAYNSAPLDWFPSPTATPTTGTFGNTLFHTPKASTYPSHFQDAFTTPQMPVYATPHQPQYSSLTPTQRLQTSSETLRSNYYANIQAVGNHCGGQSMPPPSQMDRSPSMVSPVYSNAQSATMQYSMNTSFDSTQMQTPPPTRGASTKKPQHAQVIAFGTPSTIASRRFMTPQQPIVSSNHIPMAQQSSMQFPQLQFSPEMYQFATYGPATAPAVPQSRILWGQSNSPVQPAPPASLDDPFAPGGSNDMSWTTPGAQLSDTQYVSFDTPAMNSFPVQAPHPRPASAIASSSHVVPSMTEANSVGVDPSLLYSSPARPILRSNSRQKQSRAQGATKQQPDKEHAIPTHSGSETLSSTDTTASQSIANLRRSDTIGTARPKGANLSMTAAGSLSRSNSIGQVPRTASPLKRYSRPSLGAISEGRPKQRTSVILTVDENGRARTETRRVEDSPTRSIRERYPALFDTDSSDDASETSDRTPSRPSSFIFEKRDERRSKAAKLDPPVENLEGLSIPRSGSSASMKKGIPPSRAAVAAVAQLRRQGSLRRSTPSRNQNRRSLISSSTSSLIDASPMDMSSSQTAPNRIDPEVDGNSNCAKGNEVFTSPPSSNENTLDEHNRRWSMMSWELQHPGQSISPQQQYHPLAQQCTQPPRQRPLLIRCVCGVAEHTGVPLIQCYSCTQWLHMPCIGLHSQAPTPDYRCFLCTRPPTTMLRSQAAR